jgi:hypothetical protein
MAESQYEYWIEAEGRGFFAHPSFAADFRLPKNYSDDPALHCAYALERAKQGDFALIPGLFDHYGTTERPIVDSMILVALAYAGPATCYPRVVDAVRRQPDVTDARPLCYVLAERRELSYIPVFLEKYLSDENDPDAAYMITCIRDIVGPAADLLDLEDCRDQVLDLYQQLLGQFGSDKVLLFRGEPFGVVRLARYMLDAVKRPYFRASFRRSFEAATGIDCTSWYEGGALRPLAATATLEEFLESPDAAKYEDGVRYFFGHRIPE